MTTTITSYRHFGSRAVPIPTRDAATFGRVRPQRVRDEIPTGERQPGVEMVGNIFYEEPQQRYSLGSDVYAGTDNRPLPPVARQVNDTLGASRSRVFRDQAYTPESMDNLIAEYEVTLAKLKVLKTQLASEDQACDFPPGEKRTSDARSTGSTLYAAARKHSQNYDDMPEKRARLTAGATPPVAKARMSSAEFAALRAGKGAAKGA